MNEYLMTVLDDEGEEHVFEVLAVDFVDAASVAMQEARERCIRPSCAYGEEIS